MLLHNPTAGASHPNAKELVEAIRKALGVKPSYFSTKNADWKDALSKCWDTVILTGGDGTVGKSVRWLHDRKTPIVILPLGTANDVARSLGIEGDLESLLSKLPAYELKLGSYVEIEPEELERRLTTRSTPRTSIMKCVDFLPTRFAFAKNRRPLIATQGERTTKRVPTEADG